MRTLIILPILLFIAGWGGCSRDTTEEVTQSMFGHGTYTIDGTISGQPVNVIIHKQEHADTATTSKSTTIIKPPPLVSKLVETGLNLGGIAGGAGGLGTLAAMAFGLFQSKKRKKEAMLSDNLANAEPAEAKEMLRRHRS